MDKTSSSKGSRIYGSFLSFMRKCIIYFLSLTPVPTHIAFIMDGNRRYSKKNNLMTRTGHSIGYEALMSMVSHSYNMGVKYVTAYAFSIENFKRSRDEVEILMELLREKIEELIEEDSIIYENEIRVYFVGNLELVSEPVRLAAEKAMVATASHSKAVLSICIAYTSTDEIVRAVQESCQEKYEEMGSFGKEKRIDVIDIERYMYMGVVPDPDMIVRSSGETRLSNFLLWQSSYAFLYSPAVLWPKIGFWHLSQAVLEYQRRCFYLKKNKQA